MGKKDETKTENLPVNIEEEIKKQLAEQDKQLGALPANKISLKDKKFTLPDGQSSNGPLSVVILDFVWALAHYPGVFNSSNPQQPNCVAVGRDKPESGLLLPAGNSAEPQFENCRDCPKNQWNSDPGGSGKACKNQRRVLVVPPNATEETEPMTLYVSPSSLKNFDAYVARLKNEHNILPTQAITEVNFDPSVSYAKLTFKFAGKHDNLNLMWAKRTAAQDMLFKVIDTEPAKKAA